MLFRALLPVLSLDSARSKVLQVRGAPAYTAEVMCLLRVKADTVDSMLSLSLPSGALLSRH